MVCILINGLLRPGVGELSPDGNLWSSVEHEAAPSAAVRMEPPQHAPGLKTRGSLHGPTETSGSAPTKINWPTSKTTADSKNPTVKVCWLH